MILSMQLETLIFPNDGFLMIGAVPAYLAGLWTIPLFIIVYIGARIEETQSLHITYILIGMISLLIFGIVEESSGRILSWSTQNVVTIGHVAIYIIIPEIVLGVSTFVAYDIVRERHPLRKILWALLIMLFYLGNVSTYYFLIERIILSG